MREETRKKLERALWLERAKYMAMGLGFVTVIAAAFTIESLDLMVTDTRVAGVVETVEPLISKTTAEAGVNVGVKLPDGRQVRVVALKEHTPTIGSALDITEHHHATGRVTYTLK